jgi:uncharacterized protein YcbK (DUF882 family)
MKAAVAVGLVTAICSAAPASAGQVRALKIYHVHSHEKATIVFKRNGRYDAAGLKKLNMILRDWRRNEPTRMDPRLFDLIWEVYQKSGSRGYINVIGGYRAPETNAMLRSRSKGVAEKSQHMLGKAMDFYIPDVSLRKLREIGVKFQVGGVGFYPTSGSPFVHMDVGGVRAWPRMPRRELARLFPDGKTLHRPAEGGTMPGYAAAVADYKRRVGQNSILVAGTPSSNSDADTGRRKSLLAALFSSGDENEEELVTADAREPVEAKPERRRKVEPDKQILTAAIDTTPEMKDEFKAPVPKIRPAFAEDQPSTLETALFGKRKTAAEEAMQAALRPQASDEIKAADAAKDVAAEEEKPEFTDLAAYRVPVPELLGERKRAGDGQQDMLTASLDASDAAMIAAVPVPGDRPAEDKAVASDRVDVAPVVAEAEDVDVPAADVKPEEIAALAAQSVDAHADSATDEDEIASMIDSLDTTGEAKDVQAANMAEMASLDVPKDTTTATRSFVLPADAASEFKAAALEPVHVERKIVKGARPTKADVAKSSDDGSVRTEPKLTKNLIAKWALTKGRAEEMARPVKAPRFVSRTMRKQPTEVYADGFTLNTAEIDPARFSGTAVNFMAVKKFANN